MLRKVLLTCGLLSAQAATAQDNVLLGSGCYTQSDMRDIVQLSDDEGMMLMLQYLQDGRCTPTVTTLSDWESGSEIRDTGVWVAYSSVYNWASGNLPNHLPPKQVMYFDAGSVVGAAD